MKTLLLPILSILLLFSSCQSRQDDKDISPTIQIEGVYEATAKYPFFGEGTDYDTVDRLIFKADGTFMGENLALKEGTGEVLGYRGVYSGTYSGTKEKFTLKHENSRRLPADSPYATKDELDLLEEENYTSEYVMSADFSKFTFFCPANWNCASPIYPTYFLVE